MFDMMKINKFKTILIKNTIQFKKFIVLYTKNLNISMKIFINFIK